MMLDFGWVSSKIKQYGGFDSVKKGKKTIVYKKKTLLNDDKSKSFLWQLAG